MVITLQILATLHKLLLVHPPGHMPARFVHFVCVFYKIDPDLDKSACALKSG